MLKKLFNNKIFLFLFTFLIRAIFFYYFGYMSIAGRFVIPDIGLGPIFALMFGPAGALGHSVSMFIFEVNMGCDLLASFLDFIITFSLSVTAYKLWYTTFKRNTITTPKFDSTYNIIKFIKIMFIISICYWSFINIALKAYPPFSALYPLTTEINLFSYFLDLFNFGTISGLLLISIFNILKIPLQTPEKLFTKINIKINYFRIMFVLLPIYTIIILTTSFDNTFVNMIIFIISIITITVFNFNKIDSPIENRGTNYSIIEKIILIFIVVLVIVTYVNFDTLILLIKNITDKWVDDINFTYMITIAYGSGLVLMFLIFHIIHIEKILTNPIYDLINALKGYKNHELEKNTELNKKLKRYGKRNDEISKLVKAFDKLTKSIEYRLSKIKKTTMENERIETEFNVANNIQTHMLKTDFDEFSKDKAFDEHIGFVIGDVSGKGIPATLFMVKTMYLIRNHSKFHENPKEIYENVNELSCQRNDEGLFVTSWFGKLNIKTGKLTFVNAGHEQPLIKEKNNAFEYLDTDPNFVLGGLEEIEYNEQELSLNPGDLIFLYTDGITDANNDKEEFFGRKRLKETINKYKNENINEILEMIKKEVTEFCNNEDQFDDMTMLIIRYMGSENNEK